MVNFDRSQYVEEGKLKGKFLEGKYQGRQTRAFFLNQGSFVVKRYYILKIEMVA